jgi:hypothetical protein
MLRQAKPVGQQYQQCAGVCSARLSVADIAVQTANVGISTERSIRIYE